MLQKQKQKHYYYYFRQKLFFIFLFVIILLILANFLLMFQFDTNRKTNNHQLCILFPFKNRWEIAQIVIPKLSNFLKSSSSSQHILTQPPKFIIINQTDNFRFNRATLLNIGALEAKKQNCDYIALHDIDIVPLNPELNYSYPGEGQLYHLTPGKYHPIKRYDYKNYIGGVLLITTNDFFKLNGMSNNFWGWGLEDDEFFQRLRFLFFFI